MYSYYNIFKPSVKKEVHDWCTNAKKGCTECKACLADIITEHLKPIREKRKELVKDKSGIAKILERGRESADAIASKTMAEVKKSVGMA